MPHLIVIQTHRFVLVDKVSPTFPCYVSHQHTNKIKVSRIGERVERGKKRLFV